METIIALCEKERIRTAQVGEQTLFCAHDVGLYLNMNNIRTSLASHPRHDRIIIKIQTPGGLRSMTHLTFDGVKRLLARSRSLRSLELASAFGMTVIDNHIAPIETETLRFLMNVFCGEKMVHQFICEGYRIDLYLVDHRVAVECDENGAHGISRVSQDLKRQTFLQTVLGCRFVRFQPQSLGFDLAQVANDVFRAMKHY